MRAIIQRVAQASVVCAEKPPAEIGRGLMVLVGVHEQDKEEDAAYILKKLLSIRVFSDEGGKPWTKSVTDLGLEILVVSNFTLYGDCKKNKPDFRYAMGTERAKAFYTKFVEDLGRAYRPELIKDGVFGAMMNVHLVNDGPVTLVLDTRERKADKATPSASPTPDD
eukprot:tig00001073_g6812.t1